MIDTRRLTQSALLLGLPPVIAEQMAAEMYELAFAPDQLVMLPQEPCKAVYMVAQGVIRGYFSSTEGREFILDYLVPGDFLNLDVAVAQQPTYMMANALVHTTLYAIPTPRFQALMRDHPALTENISRYLAQRVHRLSLIIEGLALHSVRTRLARFLLARADGKFPHQTWTQDDIAANIGTVRDVVGRILREFIRTGVLRRERNRMVIVNRKALEYEAMQA